MESGQWCRTLLSSTGQLHIPQESIPRGAVMCDVVTMKCYYVRLEEVQEMLETDLTKSRYVGQQKEINIII